MADDQTKPAAVAPDHAASPSPEMVDAAHHSALEKKERKPGSGRHPAGCMCAIHGGRKTGSAKPGPAPVAPAPVVEAAAMVDREAVKLAMAGVLKTADELVRQRVGDAAIRLSSGDTTLATSMVKAVAMHPTEADTMAGLTATICERHALLGKYAPEILLVVCLGGYVTRTATVLRKLSALERLQANARRSAGPATAKPTDNQPAS